MWPGFNSIRSGCCCSRLVADSSQPSLSLVCIATAAWQFRIRMFPASACVVQTVWSEVERISCLVVSFPSARFCLTRFLLEPAGSEQKEFRLEPGLVRIYLYIYSLPAERF